MSEDRSVTMLLSIGLFTLGLLIGTLVAMSAHSLAQGVLASLFALFGGSLLGLLQKVPIHDQFKVAAGILAISVGTLIGLYSGIYVNEHQLLTPVDARIVARRTGSSAPLEANKYLRSTVLSKANAIDQQYRNGGFTDKQAYDELRKILTEEHD